MSKLSPVQVAHDHKELAPMRPSPFAVRNARHDDQYDAAAAVLSAWLAPRATTGRGLVPALKRLMKQS